MLVVWKNLISLLLKNKSISRVYRIIFSCLMMSLLFDNDRQHYFVYINTIWENHTICDCMYKFLCFLECIYFRCLKDDLSNGMDQKKKCYYIFKHSKNSLLSKVLISFDINLIAPYVNQFLLYNQVRYQYCCITWQYKRISKK